jgi:glyoxylase-like metal-dependent hydrolase (beta-lactamase superfamily II)
MKIYPLETGNFKLDGGAMFGVVPKALWSRTNPADGNNMCTWAMRCMLIEDGNRLILIDTGIGDKQDEKFFSHYYLHGDYTLAKSLRKLGFHEGDITDVVLTHLHFDHCGGGVKWKDAHRSSLELVFPNAHYWSNEQHWEWAVNPNKREKASFLKENILPIKESGQLNFIQRTGNRGVGFHDNISFLFVDGHTESQMIPIIDYQGKKIVFMADLLPSVGHIPIPYVMGYDTRPLLTLDEKEQFFKEAIDNNYILFFEHDADNECCTLQMTEKGPRLKETFAFSEI